ncbi:MAG TPA: hypothetical protein VGB44_06715 [Flavobacterium sp.]|jgi:hypothetical protein
MNQSIFTIGKPVLLTQLKDMSRPFGRSTNAKSHLILELTITDKLLTLVVPGARIEMYCETRSTCKATVGFMYFLDIVKTLKGKVVTCAVTDGTLEINGLKIKAETTFFSDDSILRSIKLPLNYSDRDLLRLESAGYTTEVLLFNKLHAQIEYAREKLAVQVSAASKALEVYGVKHKEIEELVLRKLMS